MDHVPYPRNPSFPKIEIPYICGLHEDYDGQGFFDYPVRRHWAEAAETFQWMDCSPDELVKRIQNWLYFGLLHEILDQEYRKESFLRRNSGGEGYVIDTTLLPGYLSRWTRSVQKLRRPRTASAEPEPGDYLDYLDGILVQTNIQCDRADNLCWESRFITLSVKVLLQSVQQAISNIDYRDSSAMYHNPIFLAKHLFLRTSLDTWCHGQAVNLCAKHSVIMYNYLAALPRRAINLDHRKCLDHKCLANNVNVTTYKTQHVGNECQCRSCGPDIGRVIELIREGSIPLLSVALNSDGDPQFEVIKAEPGLEYTAISHVWVGGLGNFTSNELPECQVRHLSDLVKELNKPQAVQLFPGLRSFRKSIPPLSQLLSPGRQVYRPPIQGPERNLSYFQGGLSGLLMQIKKRKIERATFWMDTLLIPVGEANAALRDKAIQSMALIYARAKNVLVLDAELQNISLHEISLEQACAHVLSSSWMTRCWTLQEACLSGNWVVQFKDGIMDPYVARERALAIRRKALKESAWNDEVELIQESIAWYDKMPGLRRVSVFDRSQLNEIDNFINTWNQLLERSTSKAEDLHFIFANMLDLPAGEIIKLQHDQRMKAILSTQATLPLSLLYARGPKIDDIQNRWIPRDIQGGYMNALLGEMTVTTKGILFGGEAGTLACVGLLVPSSVPRFEKFRIVATSESEPMWVRLRRDGADPDLEVPGSLETCYMMGQLHGITRAEKQSRVHPGARFAVMGHEGHLLRLRYEYSFRYEFARPMDHISSTEVASDNDEFPIITQTTTTKDQSFCLDCGEYFSLLRSDNIFLSHGPIIDQSACARFRFFLPGL